MNEPSEDLLQELIPQNLPPELIFLILRYMSLADLKNIAQFNQFWKAWITDNRHELFKGTLKNVDEEVRVEQLSSAARTAWDIEELRAIKAHATAEFLPAN